MPAKTELLFNHVSGLNHFSERLFIPFWIGQFRPLRWTNKKS